MAWRTFLALSLGSALAAGCTTSVSVNGGTNDGGGAESGTGTGGKSTGGSSSGGASTGGGGASSGGGGASSGGNGTGGGTVDSGPATCDPSKAAPGSCTECVETYCCQEYLACQDERCNGKTDGGSDGELNCMIDCLRRGFDNDGGSTSRDTCEARCRGSNAFLDVQTRDIIGCMVAPIGDGSVDQRCGQACFHGQAQ